MKGLLTIGGGGMFIEGPCPGAPLVGGGPVVNIGLEGASLASHSRTFASINR